VEKEQPGLQSRQSLASHGWMDEWMDGTIHYAYKQFIVSLAQRRLICPRASSAVKKKVAMHASEIQKLIYIHMLLLA
jgi:hypothetical protein